MNYAFALLVFPIASPEATASPQFTTAALPQLLLTCCSTADFIPYYFVLSYYRNAVYPSLLPISLMLTNRTIPNNLVHYKLLFGNHCPLVTDSVFSFPPPSPFLLPFHDLLGSWLSLQFGVIMVISPTFVYRHLHHLMLIPIELKNYLNGLLYIYGLRPLRHVFRESNGYDNLSIDALP